MTYYLHPGDQLSVRIVVARNTAADEAASIHED